MRRRLRRRASRCAEPRPLRRDAGRGVAGAAGVLAAQELDPLGLSLPLQPLGAPALPWTAALGLLVAALPGVLTPLPPVTRASAARRASGAPARAVATPQESA